MGGAPVIEDGTVQMMESMAIVQYLLERYDAKQELAPPLGSPERSKYLQWFHFAEATLAPPVVAYLWASGMFPAAPLDEAALVAPRRRIRLAVGFIDDTLAESPFVAGERFSAADIGIWWVRWLGRLVNAIDFVEFPHTAAYMARIEARPALQTAMTIPEDYVREPPGSVETPERQRRS
jgi:glutathione S-transferase